MAKPLVFLLHRVSESMMMCLEKKLTLAGTTQAYSCDLLHYETGFGVLRYVIDREYDIAGLKLAPDDVTIALYWENRPYTLYIWRRRNSPPVYYFNIADWISLSPQEFSWRDLAVDILVDSRGVQVLDEHELPPDIDPDLKQYVSESTAHVLSRCREIISEASDLASAFG